jgi:hypothetical protein
LGLVAIFAAVSCCGGGFWILGKQNNLENDIMIMIADRRPFGIMAKFFGWRRGGELK